jgi:hypothetical protein
MKRRMLTLTMGLLLVALASLAWGNPILTSSSSGSDWWFFSIMILFYCVFFLIMAAYYVFLILALVDIARAQNEGNWKLMWALISIFAGLIGMAVYWFVGRHDRIPPKPKPTS